MPFRVPGLPPVALFLRMAGYPIGQGWKTPKNGLQAENNRQEADRHTRNNEYA